jgi:myo-inositol-1(or 4)-monophosphatase
MAPVTDTATTEEWLGVFRRAVEAQKAIFAEHVGIEARTEYEGVGEGGDNALVIDRLCEDAVLAELEGLHETGHEFTVVSEERGTVDFGDGSSPIRVVVDPIDGSLNARRTVPLHCLSAAVADGDSLADVTLGYVYEFGADEEFVAVRGEGAQLDGRPITAGDEDLLELVAIEASKPERVIAVCEVLAGKAYRVRCPGTIATSLCYVAAGRFDGLVTTRPCRSVDAAAAQLILREAGGEITVADRGLAGASVGLDDRYHCAGARTAPDLETLLEAQRALG